MAEEKKDVEVTFVSQLDTKKPIYKIVGRTPKIETGIDRLLKLVKQKEKITLSEASENLGIPKDTIMSWGEVLEDHGLLEMHYPITGKPSLWKIRPKILKGKKGEKIEKPKSAEPGKGVFGGRPKTKVFFINLEIVVLGMLLVYIFFINRQLSINFVPTLGFHYSGFTSYLMRLPDVLSTGNISIISSNLLLQPLYFALLLIIVIIIILIIIGIVRYRRHKGRIEYKPEKEKKEKKEVKKEKKKEIKVENPKKKEDKKEKKKEKKDGIFSDIIKDYKEKLKEME